ncbi:MAG: hypothetical protein ABT940_03430 [Alphaproteobacteria bacterium]
MKQKAHHSRFLKLLTGMVLFTGMLPTGLGNAQPDRVSITISDWGSGMTPVMPPYANKPEAVVISQNFYSTQPGGRQLRSGYVELVDSTSANQAAGNSGVDAIAPYDPGVGGRRLMYAIGGKWLLGNLDTTAQKMSSSVIVPYLSGPSGTKLKWEGDSAWYPVAGARFLEHLQVGDTLSFGQTVPTTYQRRIRWIIDNNKVKFTSGGLSSDSGTYTVRRRYHNDSAIQPFYLQYRDEMFTGTKRDRPQVIYPTATNTYAIRPMAVAESLYIDDIHYLFGDTSSMVVSQDTSSYSNTPYIYTIQVVDRRKSWPVDIWATDETRAGESFYFRFGSTPTDTLRAMTFRILGNTDTSVFLAAMFLGSSDLNNNYADSSGRLYVDTLDFDSAFIGGMGYVMSACGGLRTVHTGLSPLKMHGGGVVFTTNDSLHADSLIGTGGIYFVHPLTAFSVNLRKFFRWSYSVSYIHCDEDWPVLDEGCDWVTEGSACYTNTVGPNKGSWKQRGYRCPVYEYGKGAYNVWENIDQFVYFPIIDITNKHDTMHIRSSLSYDPGLSSVSIPAWEIVRAEFPMFEGMFLFQSRLFGWGDTTSPGTLSRSKPDVPGQTGVHAWSGLDDIIVGQNPSEQIVAAAAYDDQVIFGTPNYVVSTGDGVTYSELSRNIGMVSARGAYPHNKEVYFASDDGVYSLQRRDYSGYSISKMSTALDPAFNRWGATAFGSQVVPFTINRKLIDQMITTFNPRDQHLYLFFAEGTSTYNNRCVTYDLKSTGWDGYFTFGAGAAISTRFHDTTRLLIGSPTGPVVYAYDYNYSDNGSAITGVIQGANFFVQDEAGWPIETKLDRIAFLARSTAAGLDTVFLLVQGERVTDTFWLEYDSSAVGDSTNVMYSSKDNISTYWKYKLYVKGTTSGAIYQPHRLSIDLIPVRRDD